MNLSKCKQKSPQKIADKGQLPIETLLEKGVSAEDIVKEVGQYFGADDITKFVKHFMTIYEISDATIDAREDLINSGIEAQGEMLEKYKNNLELLVQDGKTSYEDIFQTIDDICQVNENVNYETLINVAKDAFDKQGDYKNIWEVAQEIGKEKYPELLTYLSESPAFNDVTKQQVVLDIIGGEYLADSTKGVKDPGNLDERAELVEKYTEDLTGLCEDGKFTPTEVLSKIDEVCADNVKEIADKLSEKMGWPESLDNTLFEYIEHTAPRENTTLGYMGDAIAALNEIIPEEDKLVVVDALLG